MKFLSRFVDSNDRELRRIQPWVDEANALEAEFEGMSPEQIRTQFAEIRDEVRAAADPEEPSDDELHHEDLERRREQTKARRTRENETSSSSAAPSYTRVASPRCGPARGRRWSHRWPRSSTH